MLMIHERVRVEHLSVMFNVVTDAADFGREVHHDVASVARCSAVAGIHEIGNNDFNLIFDRSEILPLAAFDVVHHAYFGSGFHESFNQPRTNETAASGDED